MNVNHAASSSIGSGKFSRSQRATSAGSSSGAVEQISQQKVSAPSCGTGRKVTGIRLLETAVFSSKPSLRTTRQAIGDVISR